jgi:hypothetical protein
MVQRGTMHGWRNPSETEWVRFAAVVVGADPVVVGGKVMEGAMPDVSGGVEAPSGN